MSTLIVSLCIVVENDSLKKQYIFPITVSADNHLKKFITESADSLDVIDKFKGLNADIILRQPDSRHETVAYELINIDLYNQSGEQIPTKGVFQIEHYYYDTEDEETAEWIFVITPKTNAWNHMNDFAEGAGLPLPFPNGCLGSTAFR